MVNGSPWHLERHEIRCLWPVFTDSFEPVVDSSFNLYSRPVLPKKICGNWSRRILDFNCNFFDHDKKKNNKNVSSWPLGSAAAFQIVYGAGGRGIFFFFYTKTKIPRLRRVRGGCRHYSSQILSVLQILHDAGHAPDLYATFDNGLVYKYIRGETLTTTTVRDPYVYRLVAKTMARFHRLDVKDTVLGGPRCGLWNKIEQFAGLLPDRFDCPATDQQSVYRLRRFNDLYVQFLLRLD